ncbi:HIR complex subunit [Nowakowskiella sp. JEL0078]|nr:HIR complex subunit [Nowakowskiella sp. JEL0078]
MFILISDKVEHLDFKKIKRNPIYSLHCHPSGRKLATGGQDYNVKIWSMDIIMSQRLHIAEPSEDALLSVLSIHTGAVLCVRWSNGLGKQLASSSDDQKIAIWEQELSTGKRGNLIGDGASVETWRPRKILVGHESDVADLAWSPDNSFLASCGFDSVVYIWSGESFDKVKKLDLHAGFVKGVTWDPVGKFLATQADDKTLKIWRVSDWSLEHEIRQPYDLAASITFFRRLSWSPEGSSLISANGENGTLPVAPIIYRDGWTCEVSLVGHQAPIELFNPMLFNIPENDEPGSRTQISAICALGSQDSGISIWWTSKERSTAAIKQIFKHSVLDLTWTPDGLNLLACSYDGTVAVLSFDENEFGIPVSEEEKFNVMSKYGYQKKKVIIPETPLQITREEMCENLVQEEEILKTANPEIRKVNSTISETLSSEAIAAAQKVTIKNGKKRITPIFLNRSQPSHFTPTSAKLSEIEDKLNENTGFQLVDPAGTTSDSSIRAHHAKGRRKADVDFTNPPKRHSTEIPETTKMRYIMPTIVSTTTLPKFLRPPEVTKNLVWIIKGKDEATSYQLHCDNNISAGTCKVYCSSRSKITWADMLLSPALHLKGTTKFSAVSCVDGTLYVYSPAGRRDMSKRKSIVSKQNILHLLKVDANGDAARPVVTIASASIKPFGMPEIVLSDGTRYLFESNLQEWVKVWDTFSHGLDNSKTCSEMDKLTSLSSLENKLCSLIAGKQSKEYKNVLRSYARKLADEGSYGRVIEFCDELMGQNIGFNIDGPESNAYDPVVLGFDKRELLIELLPILGQNRDFQRIMDNYQSLL